ncbi:glycosyltransferase family 17 protein [Dothistroma septosporum NZE10]|uniref:Glycosyltransferase family 17 protein n=1 Tax=Dothistroma septosporum (strain NZE10 / CBS 128990) TaxID=675120 RepID=M2YJ25_DOTSN|nr:glycosyltransferase family 17 protein [Dothistroma septosporum NZE10]
MADLASDYAEAHDDVKRDEIGALCRFHGFKSYGQPRKVYDLVACTSDLDWLEIRLNTLAAYVDYFVIAESTTRPNGSSTSLVLSENWERFKDFHNKIIYRSVEMPATTSAGMDSKDHLPDAALAEVLASITGTEQEAKPGDVLIVGDMNELPRPGTISILRHCRFPSRTTLASQYFLNSFSLHRAGSPWLHPQATTFGSSLNSTILPSDLRKGSLPWSLRVQDIVYLPTHAAQRWWDRAVILDAGWYCKFCHGTVADVQTKLQDISGFGPANNASMLWDRIRAGNRLLGQDDEVYKTVEQGRMDMPEYVWEQWKEHGRFGYLIGRSGPNAGFADAATLPNAG